MKRSRFSEPTYYAWKKKYGGMDVSEARRLRALEEENSRLKRLVADLSVQNQILKEANAKNGDPVDHAAGGASGGGSYEWKNFQSLEECACGSSNHWKCTSRGRR